MEIKSAEFDKVKKIAKNQFRKSSKINYANPIASAKCLKYQRLSHRDYNNSSRKIIVKKTPTFQGQCLRMQVFQNVENRLLNFDNIMEK